MFFPTCIEAIMEPQTRWEKQQFTTVTKSCQVQIMSNRKVAVCGQHIQGGPKK